MNKSSNFILSLTVGLMLFSGCARRSNEANSLQIKGSDTMVNLGQAWAEAFMKQNTRQFNRCYGRRIGNRHYSINQ